MYYIRTVAQACPGFFTEDHIRHHLPQERGWAYIHDFLTTTFPKDEMQWPHQLATGPTAEQLARKYSQTRRQ